MTELWKRTGLYDFYVGRIVRLMGRTLELHRRSQAVVR
jgi:hypothetical protein